MPSNPEVSQPGWPSAVIAGGFQTGVMGMKHLSRRGVKVCCVECDLSMACFFETYGPAYECPNPDEDGPAWLAFMLSLSKRLGNRPVLISSADRFVKAIAAYATELSEAFRITPGAVLLGELGEKDTQYALADQYGMPIPRTVHVNSADDVAKFAATAQFPCLLKPMANRDWDVFQRGHELWMCKVAVAQNTEELLRWYEVAKAASPALVVQEIIDGPDTAKLCYFSCYSHSGERLGYSVFRELRCHPLMFGSGAAMEPMVDDEAVQLCDDFLRKIGCKGICEIEMKRDVRTHKLMMIEANPRLSASVDASVYVGVDMCWLHYLDLVGVDVQPIGPDGRDVRHIMLCRDVPGIVAGVEAGLFTWSEALRTYRKPPVVFFDFAWREWRNSLQTADRVIRTLIGPTFRRLFPKR